MDEREPYVCSIESLDARIVSNGSVFKIVSMRRIHIYSRKLDVFDALLLTQDPILPLG